MSQMVAYKCRFALALTTTAFFTIWIKLSSLWFLFCSSAKIEDYRPSRKYLSIVGSVDALIGRYSNKSLIQHRLLLVLGDAPKLTTDTISKNPIVFKVFSEKVHKLYPRHFILGLKATFILLPLLDPQSAKKQGSKKDLV